MEVKQFTKEDILKEGINIEIRKQIKSTELTNNYALCYEIKDNENDLNYYYNTEIAITWKTIRTLDTKENDKKYGYKRYDDLWYMDLLTDELKANRLNYEIVNTYYKEVIFEEEEENTDNQDQFDLMVSYAMSDIGLTEDEAMEEASNFLANV